MRGCPLSVFKAMAFLPDTHDCSRDKPAAHMRPIDPVCSGGESERRRYRTSLYKKIEGGKERYRKEQKHEKDKKKKKVYMVFCLFFPDLRTLYFTMTPAIPIQHSITQPNLITVLFSHQFCLLVNLLIDYYTSMNIHASIAWRVRVSQVVQVN